MMDPSRANVVVVVLSIVVKGRRTMGPVVGVGEAGFAPDTHILRPVAGKRSPTGGEASTGDDRKVSFYQIWAVRGESGRSSPLGKVKQMQVQRGM